MDKYYLYEIQEGDTLSSIAKANFISLEELITFHNQHCGVTQQIMNGVVPHYVSKLYIIKPEFDIHTVVSLPNLPPYANDLIYKEALRHIYEVNVKTGVVYLGNKLSENENML